MSVTPYVSHRFTLDPIVVADLQTRTPRFGFNGVGEVVYKRTYARLLDEGLPTQRQENWAETIVRVTNGIFSIRKDWYHKRGIDWDDDAMQEYAAEFARAMFDMHFLPPGRGLWAMGSDYVYERGSMALYNCAFSEITNLAKDAEWVADALMCGVGVGFSTEARYEIKMQLPSTEEETVVIPDTREGWAESIRLLINSYAKPGSKTIIFDYNAIRPAGTPIKGFGGIASGPKPLEKCHERMRDFCARYVDFLANGGDYSSVRLIADIMNSIGACVVAGNVRRSAEIALGSVQDQTFRTLKDYDLYPERMSFGGFSNNSVILRNDEDFLKMPQIARGIVANGEPGFLNMVNISKFGRLYEPMPDNASGCNPCGEIPLADKEVCNLAEVFPTRCPDVASMMKAFEFATFYASTVSLLPTHSKETNKVVNRNRRIGISISGVTAWLARETSPGHNGISTLIRQMREAYKLVRNTNAELNDEAGVRRAIRVTTIKPSGSISLLAGVPSGCHNPEYTYWAKNMRIPIDHPIRPVLDAAGVPNWKAKIEDRTWIYRFPMTGIYDGIEVPTVQDVSLEQQYMLVETLYRHWADNMVSVTLKFKKSRQPDRRDFGLPFSEWEPIPDDATAEQRLDREEGEALWKKRCEPLFERDVQKIEEFLSKAAGNLKSVSLMPIFEVLTNADGSTQADALQAYPDLPEEPLSKAQYDELVSQIKPFVWGDYFGDGEDTRYCEGGACEVVFSFPAQETPEG